MQLPCIIVLILAWPLAVSTTDIQSSILEIEQLLTLEIKFVASLRNLATFNPSEAIQRYLDTYQNHPSFRKPPDIQDIKSYVHHPLNALSLIKRTSFDYEELLKPVLNPELWPLDRRGLVLECLALTSGFPDVNDYSEACGSIALLQEAFGLRTEDLANGAVVLESGQKYQSVDRLSWMQKFHLGVETANRGWLDTSYAWLKLALDGCPELCGQVEHQLSKCIHLHDQVLKAKRTDGIYRTFDQPIKGRSRKTKRRKKQRLELFKIPNDKQTQELKNNFHSLCRGRVLRTPAMDSKLRCRFLDHQDPYTKVIHAP